MVNADDELMGRWEIRYPGADGMIIKDYAELLELRPDGTFSWNPTPLWAKPEGRWGVTRKTGTQQIKLYFEERSGQRFRSQWVVFTTIRFGERELRAIHWQRKHYGAVVFDDRIFTGRRIAEAPVAAPITAQGTYPHLIVRLMAAVYMQECITIEAGPAAVEIVNHRCRVSHPAPFDAHGAVSPECRALIIDGVLAAVRNGRFRMCVFWGPESCTYCEREGATDSTSVPSGGLREVNNYRVS
jgi:hypothetical protein